MTQKRLIKGTYEIHVGNYDWGCGVDYVIITLDTAITSIDKELFTVHVHKMFTDMTSSDYPLYQGICTRTVTDAYLCDKEGHKLSSPSDHICLKLYVSPEEGSPLVPTSKTQIFIWSDPYELEIAYASDDLELQISMTATGKTTDADMFQKDTYITPEGIRYDYAFYSPEEQTDTLFVWLHGLGEGQREGSDAYLPVLGRKGCTMAGEAFQSAIGYAHVLVPQCPTYWMDADGKESNFKPSRIEESVEEETAGILADATSYYTESLAAFIDHYAAKVGASKIAIAGCSNGGYMCLLLALHEPNKYKAVVPICEAVRDASLTDEDIQTLVDVPLYFIYSKDDPIVIPEIHEIPTIERLKKAGCKDLHASVTDHVIDTSGTYFNEDGSPYRYMGHLSWIYYDNNETDDGTGLSAWEWMRQKLSK